MNVTGFQKMVPSFLPGGVIWVYITGACLLAAAIAFLINRQVRLAGLLLALFLLLIVVTVHLPAVLNAPDDGSRRVSIVQLIKDTRLAGTAFVVGREKGGGARRTLKSRT